MGMEKNTNDRKVVCFFLAVGYNHGDKLEFKSGLIYILTYFIN